MGLVSLFVTLLAAHAARIAWTRLALTREKGTTATVRRKPTACPKDPASLMIPVQSLLGHHMMVPVLVARRISRGSIWATFHFFKKQVRLIW